MFIILHRDLNPFLPNIVLLSKPSSMLFPSLLSLIDVHYRNVNAGSKENENATSTITTIARIKEIIKPLTNIQINIVYIFEWNKGVKATRAS